MGHGGGGAIMREIKPVAFKIVTDDRVGLIAALRAERDEWKEKAEKTREAFAKMTYEALGAARDFAIAANERDAANARAEALLAALAQIANMPTYGHNTHIRASMSAEAGQIANEAIAAAAREARG